MGDTVYHRSRYREPQGTKHVEGARAKESFAGDEEIEAKRLEDEYAKSQGATGIAGAAKRSTEAYKKGLEAYRASKRKPEAETMPLRTGEKPEAQTMPKQSDYPDMKEFANAMRRWREQQRTAKDGASALANRNK